MHIVEIKKKEASKVPPERRDELIKKARKEHEKMVRGQFEFIDAQGGWLDFVYRWFPGDPIQIIKLIHGEIVDLPMGIAKHLNNTKKKVRTLGAELPQGRGVPSTYEVVSRVRFTPVEVM